MTEQSVVTYNGKNELRKHCAFIRGKYYHKERDCYFYEGIYYSPFSRYLVVDHETQERVHSSAKQLSFGIIGIENGKYTLGHYSNNIAKNGAIYLPTSMSDDEANSIIRSIAIGGQDIDIPQQNESVRPMRDVYDEDREEVIPSRYRMSSGKQPSIGRRVVKCLDVNTFLSAGALKCRNSDTIAYLADVRAYDKEYKPSFGGISAINQYDFNLAYNSEVMMQQFQTAYNASPKIITPEITNLGKYIGAKTFGVEYESWDGRVPTYDCAKSGLIPVRDGSLRHDGLCGFEYASVIMQGTMGLAAIKEQCKLLKHHAIFNEKCSMHIHVGNIERTPENLIKLYKAFYDIQDSLYELFPSCLQHTAQYKQKDYCSRLPSIPLAIDNIIGFLSDGTEKFKSFGRPHPKDSSMQHKWNVASRFK